MFPLWNSGSRLIDRDERQANKATTTNIALATRLTDHRAEINRHGRQ